MAKLFDQDGKPLKTGFYRNCDNCDNQGDFYYVYREGNDFYLDGISEEAKHLLIKDDDNDEEVHMGEASTMGLVRVTSKDVRKYVQEYVSLMRKFLEKSKRSRKSGKIEDMVEEGAQ